MDSSLRKRFMSPFSISRTTDRSKLNSFSSSWQQEQCSMQPATPRLPSGTQISKSRSIMSSGRSQEKSLKSLNQISESISERGPRQKVSRSLFSIKPRDVEEQPPLEQQSLPKQQFYPEKEQMCKRDSVLRSDLPGTDNEGTSISLAEFEVPENLPEANNMDIANDYISVEVLLGLYDEVEVWRPSHFCELLKPEAVEKFKLAISPTKACLPHFPSLSRSSTKSIINDLDFQGCGSQSARMPKEKEKFVEMQSLGEPKSLNLLTAKKRTIGGYSVLPKSEEYSPSLAKTPLSDLSTGQKRMISGFGILRCGRLTNQSYQAQAKEFQDILSSKVRQIAEVADCLQHKELLYKILQF